MRFRLRNKKFAAWKLGFKIKVPSLLSGSDKRRFKKYIKGLSGGTTQVNQLRWQNLFKTIVKASKTANQSVIFQSQFLIYNQKYIPNETASIKKNSGLPLELMKPILNADAQSINWVK